MSLNPAQRRAVEHLEGPLLVLAGAGSGKTRVIIHKIAHLVGRAGYAPHQVAAVTFTNKAAREMRQRAGRLLGAEAVRGLRISTFHTLGLEILRREYAGVGLRRGFGLFDATDSRGLVAEVLKQDNRDTESAVEAVAGRISAWKNALQSPAEALAAAGDGLERAAARQYAAYQAALAAYNAVDFDDLIARPVALFRDQPDALEAWRGRIRYLLGDEYQDTNLAQYELLRLLAGAAGCLTVVGDDDQSIYAWRGARPDNLRTLVEAYPALTVIKLEQNYRSTRRILGAANALIAHNPHLFEKRLWSELGEGETIRVLSNRDPAAEAERVAMEINRLGLAARVPWSDLAVLYRSNHQSRPIEQALRALGVPYRVTGGPAFFDRPEVRDLVAYLRLIANHEDDAAFLRVVNVPRRQIGTATLAALGRYAAEHSLGLLEACFQAGLHGVLPAQAVARLEGFGRLVVELEDGLARGGTVPELADALLVRTGYLDWLRESAREPRRAERAEESVAELTGWLRRLADQGRATDLQGLLAHLSLMDMLDREEGRSDGDAVTLMTLHAAKGLEFPHVFLVGVEEETLPHRSSMEGAALEEERRLAYVGLTRARSTLCISYNTRRSRYGEVRECEPSRFLQEIPAELLSWEGREPEGSPEERRARGRAALEEMRRMLAGGGADQA